MAAGLLISMLSAAVATEQACAERQASSGPFTGHSEIWYFENLTAQVDSHKTYSALERENIGQAYLMLAAREGNTTEQEEYFFQKALEYGAAAAYMGLYFINMEKSPEKAVCYLHRYLETGPADVLPYVILSEIELENENYWAARDYLLKAKKVARGRAANLDWLLFQANYLLGDYAVASSLLDSAITRGRYMNELRSLVTDPRFTGLAALPEFSKYESLLKGTSAKATE
jgi:hypothetical protein